MRIVTLTLALLILAPLASAQPNIHPADRMLLKVGIGAGYGGGVTYALPSFYSDYPCYNDYYHCGGYISGYQVDGSFDFEVLSTHTLYFSPASRTDPYVSGFLGFGSGIEEFGFVWSTEAGVNYWLTNEFGLNAYLGYVDGERFAYTKVGVGLVLSVSS